ncbi:hypothetical protein E2C01_068310 [Portunus trituberculatus]|uniref:Uncharacterized protein n=1 Tax=Portunus trituberculatus TaxID=210409 RepID=A0A5B7HXJ5_PORTR|nr:hypothetical protein [Portunus trituberculatus]
MCTYPSTPKLIHSLSTILLALPSTIPPLLTLPFHFLRHLVTVSLSLPCHVADLRQRLRSLAASLVASIKASVNKSLDC